MQTFSRTSFQKKLLTWYRTNARDLPWRRTQDPYAIWVSEIMLQQTQVETVRAYYKRWMEKFPDVGTLAKASSEEVLGLWAGLGYYRRARMLHLAARDISENHQGKLPQSAAELQKLPGIGRYTAGAIASIAFGEKTPVLDGNVIRILTRLSAFEKDTLKPSAIQELWALAESLVPNQTPGDFNQAMMELGATVCHPANPDCGRCPVSTLCCARALKKETFYPVKSRREKIEKIKSFALVFQKSKKVLIRKQSETARWGGMWLFPFWDKKTTMLRDLKNQTSKPGKWLKIRHGFTKYLIDMEVYTCLPLPGVKSPSFADLENCLWVDIAKLPNYALPAPHRKIAEALGRSLV